MRLLFTLLFLFTSFLGNSQQVDEHFKVDQFGYTTKSTKVAIIANPQSGFNSASKYTPGTSLQLRKDDDNTVVFTGNSISWKAGQTHAQSGDKVWWFDFTSIETPGSYHIYDAANNKKSYSFKIADEVYFDVLKQAVRMFYYQRCNMAKQPPYANAKWADAASHQQDSVCRSVLDQGNAATARDLRGGWYDAGDLNKYSNFTYQPVHQLLAAYEENPSVFTDDYNIPESGNGVPDVLDELKWELDWLLKMQLSNGSVLCKVGVTEFQGASPASADNTPRFYGPALASTTRIVASNFAYASIVYRSTGIPAMVTYADTLLARAERAWNWVVANPATSNYNNQGFLNANPENDAYNQEAIRTCAAVYLYAATGKITYRNYFDANYTNLHPYQWTFWYPFEPIYCDAMLYYTKMQGASTTVVNNIKNNCIAAVNNTGGELLAPYNNQTDAYRAYLKDNDYVWGSNQVKSNTGTILYNMLQYNLSPENASKYRTAAEDYIHFLHGSNPINKAMLSNMGAFGAENSLNEMYHVWFGDGTKYDNALTSPNGPPPGYLAGGFNPTFTHDGSYAGPRLAPPLDQPVQKSFKDWNTSFPENSWQLTEPAIYYQTAYIKLLSKFVKVPVVPLVCAAPNALSSSVVSSNSALVKWSKSSSATTYALRYKISTASNWTSVNQADTSELLMGLVPSSNYLWQVKSICTAGDSSTWSDTATFTTLSLPCNAPDTLITTNVTPNEALLSWNKIPNAASYVLRYKEFGSPDWILNPLADTSSLLQSLLENTKHVWQVRSICAAGDSSTWSDTATFTTLSLPCNAPDTLITINVTPNEALLSWNKISNAASYVLRYKEFGSPDWILHPLADTSSLLQSLFENTNHVWQVRSICGMGDSSTWSNTVKFTTLSIPLACAVPNNLVAFNTTATTSTLAWSAAADSYLLRYKMLGASVWNSELLSDTQFTVTALSSMRVYQWQVLAICANDSSAWSDTAYFETPATSLPCDSIQGLQSSQVSDSSAIMAWLPVNAASAYVLRYRQQGASNWFYHTTTDTSKLLTGLSQLSAYTCQVASICNANDTCAWSSEAKFTTLFSAVGMFGHTAPQIKLFPNPSQGSFLLANAKEFELLEVYNSSGQLVMEQKINSSTINFGHDWSKGIYLLRLTTTGKSSALKLLKE